MTSVLIEGGQEEAAPEDQQYPDRPHLRDSRQINWCRTTVSPTANGVIDGLVAEIETSVSRQRARKEDDVRRLRATLSAMVLDLFVAAEQDRRVWLAYSRRVEDYASSLARYLSPDVTYTPAKGTADFLAQHGYAEAVRGSFSRKDCGFGTAGSGYRSRLRATDKLVELFRCAGVTRDDVSETGAGELVRLKGSPEGRTGGKPLLPYEDTDETRGMRKKLLGWAALAAQFDIKAGGFDACSAADPDDDDPNDYVEPGVAVLYRVFNDGGWERGGRFYGGWWQSLSKDVRRTITINSEPTVELDFRSLHPRMLYHLCGQPLDADTDPYSLGGVWRDVDRGVIKVAFNKLLAVGPNGHPKKPANLALPDGETYKGLLDAIEARHWVVREWFRDRRASRLQNLDSRVADLVLDFMTRTRKRPVLPVHDSFIVATRDEVILGQAMCMAYRSVMHALTGIGAYPAITGWTSEDAERAAYAPFTASIDDDDL